MSVFDTVNDVVKVRHDPRNLSNFTVEHLLSEEHVYSTSYCKQIQET